MQKLGRGASVALVLIALMAGTEALAQRGRRPDPNARQERIVRNTNVQYISMHRMAGCGLGSQAFDKDDKWSQVGASLLNFTGGQSFAISFGTSNCTYDGVAHASLEKEVFVEANLADLSRDIAVGEGEHVFALAKLYGCEGDARLAFANQMHDRAGALLDGGANLEGVMTLADRIAAEGVCGG